MSWIKARIRIVPESSGTKVSADQAHRFIDQINQDALYGTYAELDAGYWKSRMDRAPDQLSEAEMIGDPEPTAEGLNAFVFELRLASELFPPEMGGAQHLFGMFAGDLLRFTLPPITLRSWAIQELTFPSDWEQAHFDLFRKDISNNIGSIRSAFKLAEGMPLLAFSFKPRVGFNLKSLQEVATGVLAAGFNIVELDTRFLPLNDAMIRELINMAADLSTKIKPHIGRLSLNVSLPTDMVLDISKSLCDNCFMPCILKIDGGFNGFSAVQALRRSRVTDGRKLGPIVTCYPLLSGTLSNFIPSDQYIRSLAMAGVDILYPGRRPDIGIMTRSLEGSGQEAQVTAVRRYARLSREGWPMLSIAGGIYPGQLQAFYELLGPNVAWYLGGGVALHKDGPVAGAKLCVKIASEAARLKAKAKNDWSDDISTSLSEESDSMFSGRSTLPIEQLRYVSPQTHLSKINGLVPFKL